MSPIAQTCGSTVRMWPSTGMIPRSTVIRVVSRPIPSTFAARPVATRMQSATISLAAPPSGPTVSRMPSSATFSEAASKRAFVMTSMPRRLKLRSSSLLTSRSSRGTMAGRYSSSVTLTP